MLITGVICQTHSTYPWFPPFRCRSTVAVSPLPLGKLRKRCKNCVAYMKKSVALLPFLPAVAP